MTDAVKGAPRLDTQVPVPSGIFYTFIYRALMSLTNHIA